MRCNICDSMIAHPMWNKDLSTWEACPSCLEVINHAFEDPVVEDPYEEVTEEIDLDEGYDEFSA